MLFPVHLVMTNAVEFFPGKLAFQFKQIFRFSEVRIFTVKAIMIAI